MAFPPRLRPSPSSLILLWHLVTTLANPLYDSPLQPPDYNVEVDNGTYGYYPTREYATIDLRSPQTNFLQWSPACDDGLLYFIAPRGWSEPRPGPMILDSDGTLIWMEHFSNKFGGQAYDFMVQKYQGEDFLTFWTGDDRIRGHGTGHYYMLNSSYDLVHKIGAANGLSADLHEFLITPEGTALLTIYDIHPFDVTPLGRVFDETTDSEPNYIWDCVIQELALDTGDVVFEWRASEHVDITNTYREIGNGGTKEDPFDWFHLNSVEKDELGNILISARYPHVVMYIDGRTKEIIWSLGGKANDFMDLSDGYSLNFAWQHDARFVSTDFFPESYTPPPAQDGVTTKLLTLFDNAAEDRNYYFGLSYSRALLLELTYPTPGMVPHLGPTAGDLSAVHPRDLYSLDPREALSDVDAAKVASINGTNPAYRVRVIKDYVNPKRVRSSSQGSVQLLPTMPGQDPKVFVGYGLNAVWTEFDSNGTVLCDVHYGADISWERGDISSYRSYKFEWFGRPRVPPEVQISDDHEEIYVSWNGATELKEWVLQCSDTGKGQDWHDILQLRKQGFETTVRLGQEDRENKYLRFLAIDQDGEVIPGGVSEIVDLSGRGTAFSNTMGDLASEANLVRIFLILACTIVGVAMLYVLYRRYLQWRHGRPGSGALRWKKGQAYYPLQSTNDA